MPDASRLLTFALLTLAVRAATAQYGPPGERGDPYAPRGPATQVQMRYPLPGPATAPSTPAPAYAPPQPQPAPQPNTAAGPPPLAFAGQPGAPGAPPVQPQQPAADLFEPGKVLAIVGNQYVFYGDAAPLVNQLLEPYYAKAKSPQDLADLEKARPQATRQVVQELMISKLRYLEFERSIEKNVKGDMKKLAEIKKDMQKRMRDSFEKELTESRTKIAAAKPDQIREMMMQDPIMPRVAVLMRDNHAETLGELDIILRRYGSSLDKQIQAYGEDRLGRQMVQKAINKKHEITYSEMLTYYKDHADDFALQAKAKYEIMTVRFTSFPDRGTAYNTIAQMGNEVYFGAPFATIARKHSQEPGAQKGGAYDWTTKGSLASEVIDNAIFALEPGKLSQILEDTSGYHIVRVTERQEAGAVSFVEAQPKIKEALQVQKRQADYKKYIEKLKTSTPIWSIYDEQTALAQQPGTTQQR